MNVIVTCNAGSSNLKLGVFNAFTLEVLERKQFSSAKTAIEWLGGQTYTIAAISHRVVHGGRDFIKPVQITPTVLAALRQLVPLAPLHQPQALDLIASLVETYSVPHIACFDTAFHHTQDVLERWLPLPRKYKEEGMERYGFHGLSYQHIAEELPKHLGEKAKGKIIVAHLGGGSSLCAMENLQSKASTMGFSTLEGLMMSTRCGQLDAGVPLYLLQQGMDVKALERMLYKESGLLGVSGISGHMDELERSKDLAAKEAIALYCRIAARHMGGLITIMGGLDALVFTGGIGEHSAHIRACISQYLAWMGLVLDTQKNDKNALLISGKESRIGAYVIPTDEERVLAEACKALS